MEQKKKDFLMQAASVYMRLGIKSVTMDEMARQLGMSKKTIYTFVKDKNDLVEQCLDLTHKNEECAIHDICCAHDNAIDELLAVGELISSSIKSIHPSIFFDLKKYHPTVMQKFDANKNKFIKPTVVKNYEKGKEQGLYRENLNSEILADMYLLFIDVLFKGELVQDHKLSYHEIYSEYFRYHIRGLASDKGLKYLQEIKKSNKFDI